jgi:cardiolipin synthase
MNAQIRESLGRLFANAYAAHLIAIAGFVLAFFLVARLMSEKRAPANTFAWLLIILLVPYVGVPLYLLLGGRKLRRVVKRKSQLHPALPFAAGNLISLEGGPVAHALTSAGASAPVSGNRLRLLTTGEDEFAELERQIREARHSIHLTTFILRMDDTGRRVVELLTERAKQGVKVRLLLDAIGCLFASAALTGQLKRAGGEVGRFMPVIPFSSSGSANLRLHRKMAVFDHATAILGGRNIGREYMGPAFYKKRWRDFGAVVEGPAAALLNDVFIADWCFATRQPPECLLSEISPEVSAARGDSELQVVASGPDVPGDPLYEGIISMIQEAEQSVWIVTPYFIPDEVLLRTLVVKARAGREVTLVVPAHSNHPITDFARRYYIRELKKSGARVLIYPEGMLHAKAIIVDERTALFGSANFDLRSLFVNFEIGVFVYSRPDVLAIKAWASELIHHCREQRPERSRRRRILGNVAEDISRLLAPLL